MIQVTKLSESRERGEYVCRIEMDLAGRNVLIADAVNLGWPARADGSLDTDQLRERIGRLALEKVRAIARLEHEAPSRPGRRSRRTL